MELDLTGKSVIITGGGSNIGRAVSHAFGTESAHITIAELVKDHGDKVAEEILSQNPNAQVRVVQTDITQPVSYTHLTLPTKA